MKAKNEDSIVLEFKIICRICRTVPLVFSIWFFFFRELGRAVKLYTVLGSPRRIVDGECIGRSATVEAHLEARDLG